MNAALVITLIVVISTVPPLLMMAWVRNREGHAREPWPAVMRAFLYGAVIGSMLALLLNTLFDTASYTYGLGDGLSAGFLTAVIAAPFIEEATKGGGLGLQRRMMLEMEDGLVYGAAIGLGFAATENIIYGASAWLDADSTLALQTVLLRAISSTVMHGGASALLGFGYGRAVLGHGFGAAQVIPYYLIAVALHAAYNLLVSVESLAGLAIAIVMAWAIMGSINNTIRRLDSMPHQQS